MRVLELPAVGLQLAVVFFGVRHLVLLVASLNRVLVAERNRSTLLISAVLGRTLVDRVQALIRQFPVPNDMRSWLLRRSVLSSQSELRAGEKLVELQVLLALAWRPVCVTSDPFRAVRRAAAVCDPLSVFVLLLLH